MYHHKSIIVHVRKLVIYACCSGDRQRRESEVGVRSEMRSSDTEMTLEDQMLEQSGYASHGE